MSIPQGARDWFDWFFRSRENGKLIVAQIPNAPLTVFLVVAALRVIFEPSGDVRTVLSVVGTVALTVWAVWEISSGVNPFRRVLGAAVVAWEVWTLVIR